MNAMMPSNSRAAARAKRAWKLPKEALLLALVVGCVEMASHLLDDVPLWRDGWVDGDLHYRRILSSPVDDLDESADAESPYAVHDQIKCDQVVTSIIGEPSPSDEGDGKFNALRRTLAMDYPLCYERYFDLFASRLSFRLKDVRKHLTLNAGGTSLCRAARIRFETFPRDQRECWELPHFDPERQFKDPWTALQDDGDCATADKEFPEFVMKENYLSLPLCSRHRFYSIVLRDAADRAASQERQLARIAERGEAALTPHNYSDWRRSSAFEDRLSLVRNNYVTWSLTASLYGGGPSAPLPPDAQRLVEAKRALMKFDFILALEETGGGALESGCNAAILRLMGFKNETQIVHKSAMDVGPEHAEAPVSREAVEERNGLDIKLVEFGRRLHDIDCAFFKRAGNSTLLRLPPWIVYSHSLINVFASVM